MEPDEPVSEAAPVHARRAAISRDNVILLSALSFLGIAIVLALVTPRPATTVGGQPTQLPLATPAVVGALGETATIAEIVVAYPVPTEPGAVQRATDIVAAAVSPTILIAQASTPTQIAQPTQAVPTFAPVVPTAAIATPQIQPTAAPPQIQPTFAPITPQIQPTSAPPQPVATPTPMVAPTEVPPTSAPLPPVQRISGTVFWRAGQPVNVPIDVLIPPDAALVIEPGADVRIAPGVSIIVQGKLYGVGKPGAPARIGGATPQRWEGIFGQPGSDIIFEQTEIRGGGAGGTLIGVEGGTLALRGATITDNGGQVRVGGGRFEMRDSAIAGNDIPYGAALDIAYDRGGTLTLFTSRVGGNRLSAGAPMVRIAESNPAEVLSLDVQRNLFEGQDGPNLTLVADGQIQGRLLCNTLIRGANGLSIRSSLPQVPGLSNLQVRDNAIEDHIPPIIPTYLRFGIGRGATSDVALDMRNNWWESDTGPYEPDRNADGRGDSPGDTIGFFPWLRARPACAPRP